MTVDADDALPRLPLPNLQSSCSRFLEWCAPLLEPAQLRATEQAVAEFLAPDSPARRLQAELSAFDAAPGTASWLDRFWPTRYLGRRDRIALNANFFFLFTDTDQTQYERGASLILGALAYKAAMDSAALPAPTARGNPLSTVQNRYLFSSTRIPGDPIDTARVPDVPADSRHIVVFSNACPYRLDVLGPGGTPHSAAEIELALAEIVVDAAHAEPLGLGHLTTKARAEWAASRQALLDLELLNAASLDLIETALFCVCLERETPEGILGRSDALLAGDSGNRWFDSAVSLIVFPDGSAGFNGEHCNLDGTTVIGMVDSFFVGDEVGRSGAKAQGAPSWAPIEFELDEALRADIDEAGRAFADYAAATATVALAFDDFGSNAAKARQTSPDAFVQMAIQLAQARSRGTGATYESVSTRQFRHGRTEAMRVVTPESVRFTSTMDDAGADADARRAAFRAAVDAHVTRSKQCQAGDAPEQHLWELLMIAQRRGEDPGLRLYDSPGWTIMRADHLSTSSVPSVNVTSFGFGSTSPTCIGVGYVLLPDRMAVYLSTPASVSEAMHRFAAELRRAVTELLDLL